LPSKKFLLCLALVLALIGGTVYAQSVQLLPSAENDVTPAADTEVVDALPLVPSLGMQERVSLEFRATEAADVLRYLFQKAELNISISPKVSGRVSLLVNNVPIKDVFDIVLRSNNLAFDQRGEVYYIMTEAEYAEFYGEKFSDYRTVRTFRLEYAIPEQAFNLMDTLKSSIGRVLIDENSGTVVVMDTEDRLDAIQEALAVLEQPATVKVFDLRYAKALEVEEKLKDEFETARLGTIQSDDRSNQVIVRTFPARMKEVERLITALDRKTREVLIDAKIVKVTMSDDHNQGVDWGLIFQNLDFHGIDKNGDFRSATDATTPGTEIPSVTRIQLAPKLGLPTDGPLGAKSFGSLAFTTIARDGYELFRYLNQFGQAKLISKPRILVTENQEAKLNVGTREAYVTTTTTTGTSTSTTAEEVEFIDVGIQFTVTPKITRDGYVEMSIKPEVSSVIRTLVTNSGNQIPIVDTTSADTRILVKDGATVVIGGLSTDQQNKTEDEVPKFGRLPFFGKKVFGKSTKDFDRGELIIFITPHIIEGDKLVTGDEAAFGGSVKNFKSYESNSPAWWSGDEDPKDSD